MTKTAHAQKLSEPRDVEFTAKADGSPQRYVIMLPKPFDPKKPRMLMIALHGHGSDRWQFVKDTRDECRGARDVAAKNGMIYVSPDYRASTSWMGPLAEADLLQILDELRQSHKISKVILMGGSMGGSSALTFAALHPDRVDGVCSENATANHLEYQNFQDAISASFGGTKDRIPEEYKKRSAEYWPERLTMPIAITTGGQDTSVPPQSVIRLGVVLQTLKREVLVIHREKTGHSTSYEDTVAALDFVIERVTAKR
jgi:pimeloyl-ACP methyl ester carboxylesterase